MRKMLAQRRALKRFKSLSSRLISHKVNSCLKRSPTHSQMSYEVLCERWNDASAWIKTYPNILQTFAKRRDL